MGGVANAGTFVLKHSKRRGTMHLEKHIAIQNTTPTTRARGIGENVPSRTQTPTIYGSQYKLRVDMATRAESLGSVKHLYVSPVSKSSNQPSKYVYHTYSEEDEEAGRGGLVSRQWWAACGSIVIGVRACALIGGQKP